MKTLLSVLVLSVSLAGCAGTSGTQDSDTPMRKIAGVSQAAVLYVRSSKIEPVLRPVSYITTVASLLTKSAGGALGRVVINTALMPALDGPVPPIAHAEPMDLAAWETQLDRVTNTRQTLGSIEFLIDGEEYFSRLESAIASANNSIDIRTYIFDNDDYAVTVADKIKERSNDDVRVRILIDSLGNLKAMQADPDSLPESHRGPLSISMYLEDHSKVKVRNIANPWFTGDHTKTTIIDKEVAFVGGMNIGREYRYDWHDMMMEVRGPVVDQLQYESDKAWAREGLLGDVGNFLAFIKGKRSRNSENESVYPLRILQTRSFDSDIYKAQIAAIRNARSYILIQNAYFSDDRILYELAVARRRGVDVRVILPTRGNHGPMNSSNQVAINQMLQHGIRVYRFPGMSHVKAAIFDGWACVGSANFDKLSLEVNKELNLATSDPDTVAELMNRLFIPDLMASTEINQPIDTTMMARVTEMLVDELL